MIQLVVAFVALLGVTVVITVTMPGTQIAQSGRLTDFADILKTGGLVYLLVAIPLLFIVIVSEGYRRFISSTNKRRIYEASARFDAAIMSLLGAGIIVGLVGFALLTLGKLFWKVVQYAWSS